MPMLFQEMRSSNIEPDLVTYSTLIKGYCTLGDMDRAFALMSEIKQDGKMRLDEILYNSILEGCGRQQDVDKATQVLKEMLGGSC